MTLQYITSLYITSYHIALHHMTLQYITSPYITSHHIALHHIILHYIISHGMTPHYTITHHSTLYDTTSHYIISHHITFHHITLRHTTDVTVPVHNGLGFGSGHAAEGRCSGHWGTVLGAVRPQPSAKQTLSGDAVTAAGALGKGTPYLNGIARTFSRHFFFFFFKSGNSVSVTDARD